MSKYERDLREIRAELMRRDAGRRAGETSDIMEHIAPVYRNLHREISEGAYQYINLPGGRGSGKSSFCSLEIVSDIMKDRSGESNGIIFRRTAATLRESVYNQIAWAIDLLGVSSLWRGSVSPMKWTFLPTGAEILFRGLDDPGKIKSITPRKGVFRYIWIEELSELPGENFLRSVMQSVVRGGEHFTVFRSYNPPISKTNWANKLTDTKGPKETTLRTTYKDMPAEWLGESFIYEAERLREINPLAYEHEYMGIATGTGGEVFQTLEARKLTPEEEALPYIYCGLDFGFAIDPAAFVRVAYDRKTESIFVLDEIYKRHISNKQLADEIQRRGFDRTGKLYISLYGDIAGAERQRIIADSAEPKSIADLQGEGLRVIPCVKFPGCVQYRVKWLQHRKIIIDPERTPETYREFSGYEYEKTRDGELTSDLPDRDNHTIDALAYALSNIIYDKRQPA